MEYSYDLTPPDFELTPTEIPDDFKGLPVRVEGDKIFLLKGGKKRWFSSADAYLSMGFKFGDEVKIDAATLNALPEGEPIR